jgi:RDD family
MESPSKPEPAAAIVSKALETPKKAPKKAPKKPQHAWVTHDDLNVAPGLLGAPLASPWRRLLAIGVDLAVIGLLSSHANFLLLGGMALATWLLVRQRPADPLRRKTWLLALAWTGAAVMLVSGALQLWTARGSIAFDLEDTKGISVSINGDGVKSVATPNTTPAKAASSPEALEAKITTLEEALEKANKPKKLSVKSAVASWSDDLGLGLGWTVLYFSALPVWWKGQTLGKRLFKLRVVELTGKPMTLMLAFKRYGGYAAGVSTGLFGFLQVLWDSNRQALHDKAAHTVVLDLNGTHQPSLLGTEVTLHRVKT